MGTVIVGRENVEFASILALRSAMRLEVNRPGMKMSRGLSPLKIAQQKGLTKAKTKAKALEDVNAYLAQYGY